MITMTTAAGTTFTLPLTGVLDNAACNGDAGATSGLTSYTSPDLTWTGAPALGQSATITDSITAPRAAAALFTMMSTRPKVLSTSAKRRPTASGSDTSLITGSARRPRAPPPRRPSRCRAARPVARRPGTALVRARCP